MRGKVEEMYCERMEERRAFMDELDAYRKNKHKDIMRKSRELIGPLWYQVLDPCQRETLDSLAIAIKQDLIEDRAIRTKAVMKDLGIYPVPKMADLMTCILFGKRKPIEFLAELFKFLYRHDVKLKRESYPMNARLILTAVCYLDQNNLIELLMARFYTKPEKNPSFIKPKKKKKDLALSPYLQKLVAKAPDSRPRARKMQPPLRLPSITDVVNIPANFEDAQQIITKQHSTPPSELPPSQLPPSRLAPSLLPPPPPAPRLRLPRSFCDQLAGITQLTSTHSTSDKITYTVALKKTTETKIIKGKGYRLKESNQSWAAVGRSRRTLRRKPERPCPLPWPNVSYAIGGVAIVRGKPVYIINGVTSSNTGYYMINNGIAIVGGITVTIIGGFVVKDPPEQKAMCDCMKWDEQIMRYLKRSKCTCGHLYDFHNEGSVATDQVYFKPPTRHHPFQLMTDKIFDMDDERLFIEKVMRELIYSDSVIGLKNPSKKANKKTNQVTKRKAQSKCLSDTPSPADYLKCTLRSFHQLSVLASLPDAHLVPELVEWMRYRIQGPITTSQRERYMAESKRYWELYRQLNNVHWGHVSVPKLPFDSAQLQAMNWTHKKMLSKKFGNVMKKFRRRFYLSMANEFNLLWPTMFQHVMPDKSFSKVFFAYIGPSRGQYHILRPYNKTEVMERRLKVESIRVSCIPKFVSQKMD